MIVFRLWTDVYSLARAAGAYGADVRTPAAQPYYMRPFQGTRRRSTAAPLVAELRALRRLMLRHPPTNNEHTAALFISHGHTLCHAYPCPPDRADRDRNHSKPERPGIKTALSKPENSGS